MGPVWSTAQGDRMTPGTPGIPRRPLRGQPGPSVLYCRLPRRAANRSGTRDEVDDVQPHSARRQSSGSGPIARARRRVHSFFTEDIWRADADDLGWPLAPLYRVLRVAQLAVGGILHNRATFTASALTFTTVLSLVPLLAFAFSVAKGMGAYERLRTQVIDPFIDANLGTLGTDTPEAIVSLHQAIDRILELVSATDVSSLGALGLAILVLAVIRVLSGVEDAFNRIWGVRRARTPVRRVADYISLAVATPLLLVLAVTFTTGAQNSEIVGLLRERHALGVLLDGLFGMTPLLSIWLGFTLLYLLLPNTTVSPVSALLGGVVGGTLWQLAQVGHVKFQVGIANYNAIYSSFAAFPIFLVWVYASWVTVMFGAEFAHAHQDAGRHRQLKNLDLRRPRNREVLALRACANIVARFLTGKGPTGQSDLAEILAVPLAALGQVLDPLVDDGILADGGPDAQPHWLPARDPGSVRVSDVLASLRGKETEREADAVEGIYDGLLASLADAEQNLDLERLARAEMSSLPATRATPSAGNGDPS